MYITWKWQICLTSVAKMQRHTRDYRMLHMKSPWPHTVLTDNSQATSLTVTGARLSWGIALDTLDALDASLDSHEYQIRVQSSCHCRIFDSALPASECKVPQTDGRCLSWPSYPSDSHPKSLLILVHVTSPATLSGWSNNETLRTLLALWGGSDPILCSVEWNRGNRLFIAGLLKCCQAFPTAHSNEL